MKIRGFRVDPGEVAAHPQVREAVVLARGEGELRHLAAWWVPETEETACDAPSLHAWLAGALHDYMEAGLCPESASGICCAGINGYGEVHLWRTGIPI